MPQRYKSALTIVQNRVFVLLAQIVTEYFPMMTIEERFVCYNFIKLSPFTRKKHFIQILLAHKNYRPPPIPQSFAAIGQIKYSLGSNRQIDIFEFSPVDIAKRFSQLEFEIFKLLRVQEFQKEAWNKKREDAPHIRMLIDRFNAITRWVVTCIVTTEKIKKRIKRIHFFIQVCLSLREFNNFQTLYAVLSGINEGPVFRLNFTRAELAPDLVKQYDALQLLMSADKSYRLYRAALAEAVKKPPGIPYIGVYLRDATYFGDGLKSMDGLSVNAKKVKGIWEIFDQIKHFQSFPFSWEGPGTRDLSVLDVEIAGLPSLTIDELTDISRLREPKNAKRQDIE